MTAELRYCIDLLEKVNESLHRHLASPIGLADPKAVREELLRRLQAADRIADALLWTRRLDPEFGKQG